MYIGEGDLDPVQREISRAILTDRATVILSLSAGNETPSNTNENFSTRDTDTGEGGAHIHRPIAVDEAVAARKVRCQMLPTSVINPNTNLLFPSTDPRRGLKSWESWCRRLSFLQCFSWSGFVLKSLHAIRKYRNRHRCVTVIRNVTRVITINFERCWKVF